MVFSQILIYTGPKLKKRVTKANKDFAKQLDFKYIKFPVKIIDTHKIEKKNSIGVSFFGYENKEKHPVYVAKNVVEKKMLIHY